mgnify:CR=1 FL=1|jgi:hypothetical protein
MSANVDIKLSSSLDAKGFKKALTATEQLGRSAKKLAGTLGVALSTKAVLSWGAAAARAAAQDSKAMAVLSKNLSNVGLAYAEIPVENFIKQMEQQTGIADDQLRPAFSKLAQATLSISKSQELMALAFDVASGTGQNFESVVTTLSQAYLGNTKGLKKLDIQMTASELKTASFAEIQAQLNSQFRGDGKAALESYGGQLQILETAANSAKETIGYALLDALKSLTGETDIEKLSKDIDTAAGTAALFIKLTTKTVKPSTGIWGYWQKFVEAMPGYKQTLKDFAEYLDVEMFPTGPLGNFQMSTGTVLDQAAQQLSKIEQERLKAEKLRQSKEAALIKARVAAAKKEAALKKAQTQLSKASATFEIDKIQLAAALKNTYDKDERLRLLAMQAIENDNGEAALAYIAQLALLTKEQQTNKLAGITTISETELNYINQLLLDELARIKATKMSEEEAAAARAAAYAKYNAAIIQSGGLANANFYSEKTQIELLTIAKIAALDTVAEAQATMDILNYTTQTAIIARIAAAQKLADDAKLASLKAYLAEATKPLTQVVTTQYVTVGAPPSAVATPPTNTSINPLYPSWAEAENMFPLMPTSNSSSNNNTMINVQLPESTTVITQTDFVQAVTNAVNETIRVGNQLYPTGSIAG